MTYRHCFPEIETPSLSLRLRFGRAVYGGTIRSVNRGIVRGAIRGVAPLHDYCVFVVRSLRSRCVKASELVGWFHPPRTRDM